MSHSAPAVLLRIEIPMVGDAPCSAAAALLRAAAAMLEEVGQPGIETGDGCGVLHADGGVGKRAGEWAFQPIPAGR